MSEPTGQKISVFYTVPSLLSFMALKGALSTTPLPALKTLLFSLLESGDIQEMALSDKTKYGIGKNGKVYVVLDAKGFFKG